MWPRYFDPPLLLWPAHAAVFRMSAASLSECVGWQDEEEDWEDSDGVFDRLSQGQKQAAILQASKALLDPRFELQSVTAVMAATVDMIYQELQTLLELEVSSGGETTVREMILRAMDEADYWNAVNSSLPPDEEPVERLHSESSDIEEWTFLIESLEEDVLEDYDFDMEQTFVDMPPEHARLLKEQMNIGHDYFVATIEDPSPQSLAAIRAEIREVLG
jgi:hypothetical protein